MKVKYKIAAAFMLVTMLLLATICIFIYYNTAIQQKADFTKRLQNRAKTVAFRLFKLPFADYSILSKLDSATTNLLSAENIAIYNNRNQLIYRFARNYADTITISNDFLKNVRHQGEIIKHLQKKQLVAIYYQQADAPIVVVVSAIDDNGNNNLAELRSSLLMAFFAGIFLSFISGLIFSTKLLRPIEKIVSTVNNISATNIEKRLPLSGIQDEWNNLALTFNNLLTRLQESFDIQGRFISNASHELSTPLTIISNQIDVILHKPRANNEYLAVLQSVQAEIQHMSALTQQLLNIARTARGGSLQTQPVRIDEVIMDLPLLLKKNSIDYCIDTFFDDLPDDEKLCTVNGNYELLLSAFKNIAENGCKYAPDNTVHVSLSFVGTKIIVFFSNTSQFFDPNDLENIFQPFQRGANAKEKNGYGLGLSLTRRIILLHKGEIKAELMEHNKLLISIILPAAA